MTKYDLITILGPTASGKTTLACLLAYDIDAEIISGDSRQVYKNMDIGTGKDLKDYVVNGKDIPYHLIDIKEAGDKYNIYEFQQDFYKAYNEIKQKNRPVILCGGSGLYLESVLRNYPLINVPENKQLRYLLKERTLDELAQILNNYKDLHNKTDVDTVQRAIRAIEIAEYSTKNEAGISKNESLRSLIIGVDICRELRRERISKRLTDRLNEGMIEEIKSILHDGVHPEDLIYYGLEYKYITLYVLGKLSYKEMVNQLEIAIHQFAKRQMTWFRGMEKRGLHIHWLDYNISNQEKIELIKNMIE